MSQASLIGLETDDMAQGCLQNFHTETMKLRRTLSPAHNCGRQAVCLQPVSNGGLGNISACTTSPAHNCWRQLETGSMSPACLKE